jgi:MOSC domain-containing protein YiiM
MITVKSIVYKPRSEPDDSHAINYQRRSLAEAALIAGYGIGGDRKGGNPKRNLNVMDDITLAELAAEGYSTGPGDMGENIVLAGIDLRTLAEGSRLRLGSDAVIVLGALRVPCERLTPIDGRMPEAVVERVGRMCRVEQSGTVKVGDPVEILVEAGQPQ